jgi:hypothetical protein
MRFHQSDTDNTEYELPTSGVSGILRWDTSRFFH